MHTAILSWRRGLARSLAKRIGEEDWQGTGETLGEEKGKEKKEKEKKKKEEEGEGALIKSSNPHLAGGEQMKVHEWLKQFLFVAWMPTQK